MKFVQRGSGERTTYLIDGRPVTKDEHDREMEAARPKVEAGPLTRQSMAYGRPVASDALAVHPNQVAEAREDALKKGVPTDFLPDGRPLIRSRQHRNRYIRAYGFFDRDAGYGDPADGSFRGR